DAGRGGAGDRHRRGGQAATGQRPASADLRAEPAGLQHRGDQRPRRLLQARRRARAGQDPPDPPGDAGPAGVREAVMNILVTAGNTLVPIDKVRCITNIFTGKTGAAIALHAHGRGHAVTLLSSHPEALAQLGQTTLPEGRWAMHAYGTFDELRDLM